MLFADVALYLALAWYASQVAPGQGAARKWYFPLLPSTYGYRTLEKPPDDGEGPVNPLVGVEDDDRRALEARAPGAKIVVDVENLSKTFGALRAVDRVSLQLADSEVFCLLGHNGAGKTTALGVLTGLLDPDASTRRVSVFGNDVLAPGGLDALRSTLGVCPQHDARGRRGTRRRSESSSESS